MRELLELLHPALELEANLLPPVPDECGGLRRARLVRVDVALRTMVVQVIARADAAHAALLATTDDELPATTCELPRIE